MADRIDAAKHRMQACDADGVVDRVVAETQPS